MVVDSPPASFPQQCAFVAVDPLVGLFDLRFGDGRDVECEGAALTLPFVVDGPVGALVLGDWELPTPADAQALEEVAAAFRSASVLLGFLTGVHRRLVSHPAHAGLVGHPLDSRMAMSAQWSAGYALGGALETVAELVPSHYWDGTHGWFAPDADPRAFGQFYLCATSDSDAVEWQIRQVGMDTEPVDSARWDDAPGLARLHEFCRTSNREHVLAVQALTDSGAVRTSRQKHEFALAVKAARDAFARKKDQLKPRLTEAAVLAAMRKTKESFAIAGTYVGASIHVDGLVPYEVFGYRYQRDPLPAIYAAGRVLVHERARGGAQSTVITPEFHAAFKQNIQDNLDARRLGTLFEVEHGGGSTLLVVKNVALAQEHSLAFGIPADAHWTPAVPVASPSESPAA